jgi:hypothetical protein
VRPERRIAATKNRPATNRNSVGEVYLVSSRNDAAGAKREARIDLINHLGLGNGVDFIHADDFGVTSKTHFIAASYDVQKSDSYVVTDLQLLYSDNQIQMSDANVVVDSAFACVDNAETDPHALSDLIPKKQTIAWAL